MLGRSRQRRRCKSIAKVIAARVADIALDQRVDRHIGLSVLREAERVRILDQRQAMSGAGFLQRAELRRAQAAQDVARFADVTPALLKT